MPEKYLSIESLLNKLAARESLAVGFVPGSAPSWLIGNIQRRIKRPILALAADEAKAEETVKELSLFCPEKPLLFPALDYYQPEGTESSGDRVAALCRIMRGEAQVVVSAGVGIFQPTLAPEVLKGCLFELKPGDTVDRDDFLRLLIQGGYVVSASASEPGEISVRGGIINVYPPGAAAPARLEFFGNAIESIRLFNPATQRSADKAERYPIWPAREMVLTPERSGELKQALFRLAEDIKREAQGEQPVSFAHALQELSEKLDLQEHFYAEERYLPLLDKSCSLLDYLTNEWLVVVLDELAVDQSLSNISRKAESDWARLSSGGSLLPSPSRIFSSTEQVREKLSRLQSLTIGMAPGGTEETETGC